MRLYLRYNSVVKSGFKMKWDYTLDTTQWLNLVLKRNETIP